LDEEKLADPGSGRKGVGRWGRDMGPISDQKSYFGVDQFTGGGSRIGHDLRQEFTDC
jgi:hypothetical protein